MAIHFVAQCINAAHTANLRREFSAAVGLCRQALRIAPDLPEAWYNLGIAYGGLGKRTEALAALEKAGRYTRDSADAQNSIGLELIQLGALAEAEGCLNRALMLAPNYAFAHSNMGMLREKQSRFDDAENSYRTAIQLQPDLAPLYFNLGNVLTAQNKLQSAAAACRKALELDAGLPEAWSSLGGILRRLKQYEAAAECFERCLKLDPDARFVLGDLIYVRMKICDWRDLDRNLSLLTQKIERGERASTPFPMLGLTTNPALQRKSAEVFAAEECPLHPELGPIPKRPRPARIRIGYYSSEFRNHATSYLMAELFERHDRERFELVGFSFGPDSQDEMRQRVSAAFDRFIDVGNQSGEAVAKLSRELGIDIAVDLKGYTEDARTEVFSYRAAPVQVNYLGYPGTMGAEYIDYLIADRTVIPAEAQGNYTEKVVYLPHSYQVNDSRRRIADQRVSREESGLPSSGFVFCCFNNPYKINPAVFESWVRILRQVEGSVLWLFEDHPTAAENLRKEAAGRGLAPARLVFARQVPLPEHLARIRAADLLLDTWPYNAHTTASDALWAGLPVLTLMGDSFASRVAASLLIAIGLPELITTSRERYEALAAELATRPSKLEQIRKKLAQNRLSTPLFDTALFARHIEAAYQAMYERYQADLPPDHIRIEDR
jgi:predicted O-linked N-acetylglucosamine transferase (SPINDLY family)